MVPSHQKAYILASIFHQIFMFFPTPLPEVIFRGTLRRSRPKSAIFNGFWDPAGPQHGPFERHFRPKGAKRSSTPNAGERPGADLGAIWRRKRSKDAFSLIWVSFLVDFGRVWDHFGRIFYDFSSIVDVIFERIQASSFFTCFPSNFQTSRQRTTKSKQQPPSEQAIWSQTTNPQ